MQKETQDINANVCKLQTFTLAFMYFGENSSGQSRKLKSRHEQLIVKMGNSVEKYYTRFIFLIKKWLEAFAPYMSAVIEGFGAKTR